jgi:hypothetical protein
VAIKVINRQNYVFHKKFAPGGYFKLLIFIKFLSRHSLAYIKLYAKYQENPSTFAARTERSTDVA